LPRHKDNSKNGPNRPRPFIQTAAGRGLAGSAGGADRALGRSQGEAAAKGIRPSEPCYTYTVTWLAREDDPWSGRRCRWMRSYAEAKMRKPNPTMSPRPKSENSAVPARHAMLNKHAVSAIRSRIVSRFLANRHISRIVATPKAANAAASGRGKGP
jgi:hypothetical protein